MPKRFTPILLLICVIGCSSKDEFPFDPLPQDTESDDDVSPDAKGIIEAAIKAHGGNTLQNINAGRITLFTRGYVTPKIHDEISTVSTFQFPDQLRQTTEHTVSSKTTNRIYVRNRNRAWEQDEDGGFTTTTDLRRIEDLYPLRLIRELNMLRDGGFSLEHGGDVELGERTVTIVRVSRGGEVLSEVSFDSTTKLIAKILSKAYNPKTDQLGKSETVYSDYRSFGELTFPTTMIIYADGERFVEKSLKEFTIMDRVPPDLFAPDD